MLHHICSEYYSTICNNMDIERRKNKILSLCRPLVTPLRHLTFDLEHDKLPL